MVVSFVLIGMKAALFNDSSDDMFRSALRCDRYLKIEAKVASKRATESDVIVTFCCFVFAWLTK